MEDQPRSSEPQGAGPAVPAGGQPPPSGPASPAASPPHHATGGAASAAASAGGGGPPAPGGLEQHVASLKQQLVAAVRAPSLGGRPFQLLGQLQDLGQDPGTLVVQLRLVQEAGEAGRGKDLLARLLADITKEEDRLQVAEQAANAACQGKQWAAARYLQMEALKLAADIEPDVAWGDIPLLLIELEEVQGTLDAAARNRLKSLRGQLREAETQQQTLRGQVQALQGQQQVLRSQLQAAQRERRAAQRELHDARRGRVRWGAAGAALGAAAAVALVGLGWALLGGRQGRQATTAAGRSSR